MNVCCFVGHIATEPEVRYTESGVACCSLRIAVDRSYKNSAGERETDFIDFVAWRQTAEYLGNYGVKGRLVSAQGSLRINQWVSIDPVTKHEVKRRSASIIINEFRFLDAPKGSARADMQEHGNAPAKLELVTVGAGDTDGDLDFNDPFADE